jgi:hypothetical protein
MKVFGIDGDVVTELLDTGLVSTNGTPSVYSFNYCPENLYYCLEAPNIGTMWWIKMYDKDNTLIKTSTGGKQEQVCYNDCRSPQTFSVSSSECLDGTSEAGQDDNGGLCNDNDVPVNFGVRRFVDRSIYGNEQSNMQQYFNFASNVFTDLNSQGLYFAVVRDVEYVDYPREQGYFDYSYYRERSKAYFVVCSGGVIYDATDILTTSSKTFTEDYFVLAADPVDPEGCPSAGSATFNWQEYDKCSTTYVGDCGYTGDCGPLPAYKYSLPPVSFPALPQ